MPTTRSPSPRRYSVSVVSSVRQTMREGYFESLMAYLLREALPLGLPHTLSREPLRRLAPFAWLASLRSLASSVAPRCLAVAAQRRRRTDPAPRIPDPD